MILGMVSREARSGYEIKALVDQSARVFWAASYGQIYPELKRLATAGDRGNRCTLGRAQEDHIRDHRRRCWGP